MNISSTFTVQTFQISFSPNCKNSTKLNPEITESLIIMLKTATDESRGAIFTLQLPGRE